MVIPIKNLVASVNLNKADMASRGIILKIRSSCYQYCSSLSTSCFFFFFTLHVEKGLKKEQYSQLGLS